MDQSRRGSSVDPSVGQCTVASVRDQQLASEPRMRRRTVRGREKGLVANKPPLLNDAHLVENMLVPVVLWYWISRCRPLCRIRQYSDTITAIRKMKPKMQNDHANFEDDRHNVPSDLTGGKYLYSSTKIKTMEMK